MLTKKARTALASPTHLGIIPFPARGHGTAHVRPRAEGVGEGALLAFKAGGRVARVRAEVRGVQIGQVAPGTYLKKSGFVMRGGGRGPWCAYQQRGGFVKGIRRMGKKKRLSVAGYLLWRWCWYWQSVAELARRRRGPGEWVKTPVDRFAGWMTRWFLLVAFGAGGGKNATVPLTRRSVSGEQAWKGRRDSAGLRCPLAIRPTGCMCGLGVGDGGSHNKIGYPRRRRWYS